MIDYCIKKCGEIAWCALLLVTFPAKSMEHGNAVPKTAINWHKLALLNISEDEQKRLNQDLCQAVEDNAIKRVECLLKQGASPISCKNRIGSKYDYAFEIALSNGNLAIAQLLIDYGALIDIYFPVRIGQKEKDLKDLLSPEVYEFFQKQKGLKDSFAAAIKKEDELEIKELLARGAPMNSCTGYHSEPPLYFYGALSRNLAVVQVLIEQSANIYWQDKSRIRSETLLRLGLKSPYIRSDAVEYLHCIFKSIIKASIDFKRIDRQRRNVLLVGYFKEKSCILKKLPRDIFKIIFSYCLPHITSDDCTITSKQAKAAIKKLLEARTEPKGKTALDLVEKYPHKDYAQLVHLLDPKNVEETYELLLKDMIS